MKIERSDLTVDQPQLFDVDRTTPQACPVPGCGAIRLPGQDKVVTCEYDTAKHFGEWTGGRPKGCPNYPRPEHQPIPY